MEGEGCRLYLISPPSFSLPDFEKQLQSAFAGGDVACFQLRMKDAPDADILKAAEKLLPLCHEQGAAFILNDRPDLAKAIRADGVHLGDEDVSVEKAREMVGEEMIIGASCYASRHRAMEAGEQGADYVAFGAFYPTTTKKPKGRPEAEMLEWWTSSTVLPSVAIGGIKPENCGPLVKAGADFIAVVTGVWNHPEGPAAAVSAYNRAIHAAK